MDSQLRQDDWLPEAETPDDLFEAAKTRREWTDRQRAACLDRLVMRFPPGVLVDSARRRFGDLSGHDGELVLRIAESLANDDLLRELAKALMEQPDLSAERVWDALTLFQGSPVLDEFPELADLCAELEAIAQDSGEVVDELARQIESDPEGPWLALQGLEAIEPDIRAEIVSELAQRPLGPGLIDFLRLLTFAENPETQAAALDAVKSLPPGPEAVAIWSRIRREHHDPEILQAAAHALTELGADLEPQEQEQEQAESNADANADDLGDDPNLNPDRDPAPDPDPDAGSMEDDAEAEAEFVTDVEAELELGPIPPDAAIPAPPLEFEPIDALITALDNEGRGYIALKSRYRGKKTAAAFECDVWRGVTRILGETEDAADELFASFLIQSEYDVAVGPDVRGLASDLLAASMTLSGSRTPGDWRFWTERVLGTDFRPCPFLRDFGESRLDARTLRPSPRQAELVLSSSAAWLDASNLTYELAEEIALRENNAPPDPQRDAAVYRYLFERELTGRLNWSRQKLVWMAWFWETAGDRELAKAAMAIAHQLSDPQHAVPQHPFILGLTTRSLKAAQTRLAAGVDFRNGAARERARWDRWRPAPASASPAPATSSFSVVG